MTPSSTGPGCLPVPHDVLAEPVAAVTSLAFVVAGAAIVLLARRHAAPSQHRDARRERSLTTYALLVAAIGAGSVVQHGPNPPWADVAHDAPLLATLAFVAADAVGDLTGRARRWWWWAAPTVALLPVVVALPRAGDLAQVAVAMVAVALTLLRAHRRPRLRRTIGWAVGLLALGGTIGTLSRAGGPLCVPGSVWQGHAVWHVLASVALVVLAAAVGRRGDDSLPCWRG